MGYEWGSDESEIVFRFRFCPRKSIPTGCAIFYVHGYLVALLETNFGHIAQSFLHRFIVNFFTWHAVFMARQFARPNFLEFVWLVSRATFLP
jgi:hypothetical protein